MKLNATPDTALQMAQSFNDLAIQVVGQGALVPLLNGANQRYINLDNAASTPAFRRVKEQLDQDLEWYSSVHRGAGYKSLLMTRRYEQARQTVLGFVSADPQADVVIFGKNATEAINLLAYRFPFQPGDQVLTTVMEHHSNDLPWRAQAETVHVGVLADGSLDMDELAQRLQTSAGRIKLVAVTGASNVSGYMPPIYEIAELAHRAGAKIFVDCAQLLPHRRVIKGEPGGLRSLDFIAFSGHKVYAPFGDGALVGPRSFFNQGEPLNRGGGTISVVTLDEVDWADAPERDEAGSPNVLGALALATALQQVTAIGIDAIATHEQMLTRYALQSLKQVPGIEIFGFTDPERLQDRLGVITFRLPQMPHGKLAAILGFEGGIGVRDGCFCAHPYVLRLLHITDAAFQSHRLRAIQGDRTDLPGMVRISFGCYNQLSDIDALILMLKRIVTNDYEGDYLAHAASGSYYPRGLDPDKPELFRPFQGKM
jgi:cysteine desulfurase / selenocysteine lyase